MEFDRSILRKDLRKRRHNFVSERNTSFSIRPELAKLISNAQMIGGYVAIGSEADMRDILDFCLRRNIGIALPCVEGRSEIMKFRHWDSKTPLETAAFGFRQPGAGAALALPDVILTPLLGFDRSMNRLGQGAGHYDRYFAKHPNSLRIGIAWSVQEVEALSSQPWDVPLHAICTEKEWIGPREIKS